MEKLDIEGLKRIEMEILSYIDAICRKHGLRYSLCGGSLLGAVRHGGFIPWDDDIDIFLPRPDYEKLIELVFAEKGRYGVLTCFNNESYFLPFAKIVDTCTTMKESYPRTIQGYGVYVDVFPEDGVPSDLKRRKRFWNQMRIFKRLNSMVYQKRAKGETAGKRAFRMCMYYVFKLFPANLLAKKLNKMAMQYPFEKSETIAVSLFGYGQREEQPRALFDIIVDMPFENHTYRAVAGYDGYLRGIYGDYMKLPPKEQQVAKHQFEAYLLS